jgi:hypothetical protein
MASAVATDADSGSKQRRGGQERDSTHDSGSPVIGGRRDR